VLDPDFHKGNLPAVQMDIDAADLANYADVAAQKTVERAETEKMRRAVRLIGDVFNTRANMLTRILAELDEMGREQHKSWDQIRNAFLKLGYVFELEDVQRCVLYCLPGVDLHKIPVFDFLSKLKTTFHDMSATR